MTGTRGILTQSNVTIIVSASIEFGVQFRITKMTFQCFHFEFGIQFGISFTLLHFSHFYIFTFFIFRTFELSNFRTFELSNFRTFELSFGSAFGSERPASAQRAPSSIFRSNAHTTADTTTTTTTPTRRRMDGWMCWRRGVVTLSVLRVVVDTANQPRLCVRQRSVSTGRKCCAVLWCGVVWCAARCR